VVLVWLLNPVFLDGTSLRLPCHFAEDEGTVDLDSILVS
jgi:hypothetical protein